MRRCAITGAAGGIGRALAFEFGHAGYDVMGIDVDPEAIEATEAALDKAGLATGFRRADLGTVEGAKAAAKAMIERGPLDLVVMNAGINAVGAFENGDLDAHRTVLAVNLRAPLLMTARLIEANTIAPGGSLVFVSSLSRFVGYPGAASYAASKDGLASYARSLAVALAPRGVHVLTVYPGPTRTPHARHHSPDNSNEEKRMAPEDLARRIRSAVQAKRRVLVPGIANTLMAAVGHVAPTITEKAMRKAILEKL